MSIDLIERGRELSSPTCFWCRHRAGDFAETCIAFPAGIPDAIWNGDHDHQTPFPGDRGIRFERMTAGEERAFRERTETSRREFRDRVRKFHERRAQRAQIAEREADALIDVS